METETETETEREVAMDQWHWFSFVSFLHTFTFLFVGIFTFKYQLSHSCFVVYGKEFQNWNSIYDLYRWLTIYFICQKAMTFYAISFEKWHFFNAFILFCNFTFLFVKLWEKAVLLSKVTHIFKRLDGL